MAEDGVEGAGLWLATRSSSMEEAPAVTKPRFPENGEN
jgi:hypothetical protein